MSCRKPKTKAERDQLTRAAIVRARPTPEEVVWTTDRIRKSKHVVLWHLEDEDPEGMCFALVPEDDKNDPEVLRALVTAAFLRASDEVYDAERSECYYNLDALDLKWKTLGGRDTDKTVSGLYPDLVLVPFPHVYESHPDNAPDDEPETKDEPSAPGTAGVPTGEVSPAVQAVMDVASAAVQAAASRVKAEKEAELTEVLHLIDEEDSEDDEPAPPSPGTKRPRDESAAEQSPAKKPKAESE